MVYKILLTTRSNKLGFNYTLQTGRKLNAHKTFRRHPGGLLNVLCAFNLRDCIQ